MPSTTPLDIIKSSLKDAGVLAMGQSLLPEDYSDAFQRLNWMVAQWNRKRWLVYHLIDLSVVSTGQQSYTVGPGGDIDISPRPSRLESAFFRQLVQSQPNQIDFPLQILESREDYNQISIKQLTSFPNYIWYDTGWPTGTIYPWPVPEAAIYEVHISVMGVLSQFDSQAQEINLPDEYLAALHYNLTARNCVAYTRPVSPDIVALAKDSLNVLRGNNTQIARLQMPSDLIRPGIYNVYSDQVR